MDVDFRQLFWPKAPTSLSFGGKPKRRGTFECLPRTQDNRWETWLVDRIGEMLRLQAETGVLPVNRSA